jgi:hypothetical protein
VGCARPRRLTKKTAASREGQSLGFHLLISVSQRGVKVLEAALGLWLGWLATSRVGLSGAGRRSGRLGGHGETWRAMGSAIGRAEQKRAKAANDGRMRNAR